MSSTPIVDARTGAVRGTRSGGALAFLGIPFAAPPVGALRFAPPGPHLGWDGVREATAPGPAVPQPPSRLNALMGEPGSTYSEADGLNLNVWTPDLDGDRPVLFWLHGGAWVSGSGSWSWYSGARLAAEQGIVVVTANHRLGALGYLAVHGGNFGFLDEVAALEWVVDNIAAFGGDADRITVGGHSAGAESAAMLAAAPRTRAHVRRILLQSGGVNGVVQPSDAAESVARELIDVLDGDAARLRDANVEAVLGAQLELIRRRAGVVLPFGVIAHDDVPAGGTREFLRSRTDLDVMVGWTRDELYGFARLNPQSGLMTADDVVRLASRPVYDAYVERRPDATPAELAAAISGDRSLGAPTLRLAGDRAGRGEPTYVYRFDWSGSDYGACHCIDLPFTFGNLDAWPDAAMLGDSPRASLGDLAQRFTGAIGAFVRTGDPGWPAFEPGQRIVARFDAGASELVPHLGQAELRVLDAPGGAQPG